MATLRCVPPCPLAIGRTILLDLVHETLVSHLSLSRCFKRNIARVTQNESCMEEGSSTQAGRPTDVAETNALIGGPFAVIESDPGTPVMS